MKTTILLVEDLEIVRQGLRALLSAQSGHEVVGEAADGLEAIRMAAEMHPDVILMDLHLPNMDGPEAIRQIKKNNPGAKIIALTADNKDRMFFKSLSAGVDGYILKHTSCEELVRAISAVRNGRTFISPDISGHLVEQYLSKGTLPRHGMLDALTEREQQVLKLIAGGLGNKAMADKLCISPKTVEKHKANLKRKLAAPSTAALVSIAFDNELMDSP